MFEIWVKVRIPLRALLRAIDALKAGVARKHLEAESTGSRKLREEADQDDAAAEALKNALRKEDE